jgi:hypothetical protein
MIVVVVVIAEAMQFSHELRENLGLYDGRHHRVGEILRRGPGAEFRSAAVHRIRCLSSSVFISRHRWMNPGARIGRNGDYNRYDNLDFDDDYDNDNGTRAIRECACFTGW